VMLNDRWLVTNNNDLARIWNEEILGLKTTTIETRQDSWYLGRDPPIRRQSQRYKLTVLFHAITLLVDPFSTRPV
jgi:hypothetical protein